MNLRITGLDHIVLNVSDVERSLEFYVDRLGLSPVRVDAFRNGEVKFPSVRINEGCIIDLFPPAMHNGNVAGRNLNHFCLVTGEAIDSVAAALETAGIRIVDRAERNFGARGFATSIYVHDPDGNVVEIRAY